MTSISMRLELSTSQTVALLGILTEALAARPLTAAARIGVGIDVYEDPTRGGTRNGHTIRIQADGISHGVYATAYGVLVDGG